MAPQFGGFHPTLFSFLAELEVNNEREWFNENRERYEQQVREPALAFIRAMASPLGRISPQLRAVDKKVGGSLMRVHRDVRFSKDKSPYKTNVGIQFRHAAGKDVHAPGLYVHLAPDECFLGAGLWRPERDALAGIRKAIAERPDVWTKIWKRKALSGWELGGDTLQRPPRGFDPEHPLIDEIKRKDFIAVRDVAHDEALDPGFLRHVAAQFRATKPFVEFLTRAVGLEF